MSRKKGKKGSRKKRTNSSASSSNPSQVIYLDASIIGKYLWGPPDEYEYEASVQIFNELHSILKHNGNISIRISQLAVGELINTVLRFNSIRDKYVRAYLERNSHLAIELGILDEVSSKKGKKKKDYEKEKILNEIKRHMINKIFEILTEYGIDVRPLPEPEIFETIEIIKKYDGDGSIHSRGYSIKGNDLFLLAHALTDKESDLFLTTDRDITDFSYRPIPNSEPPIKLICDELGRKELRVDEIL